MKNKAEITKTIREILEDEKTLSITNPYSDLKESQLMTT